MSIECGRDLMHHRVGMVGLTSKGDRAITTRQGKYLWAGVKIERGA